jgi:putative transposase
LSTTREGDHKGRPYRWERGRAFESILTVQYIRGVEQFGWKPFNGKLWQRNYYEHIIRNEKSYHIIFNYIRDNPAKWRDDWVW